MFGGEVTMYLPVQQHSLVARCATYFTLHHNQYFPSSIMCLLLRFIMVIITKSPRIFCASTMLLRAPCNSCHMFLYKGRFQVSSNCKIAGTVSCKKKSDLSNRL